MDAETGLRRPASPGAMFRVFHRMAMQGFGGVLPIAQRELVEKERWLTRHEFVEILALCQVLPGPNVINLSLMLGDRWFGLRGAAAATAGLIAVPLLLVLVMAAGFSQAQSYPAVAGALRGMGAAAAGLLMATGWKLSRTLAKNPLGAPTAYALALLTLALVGGLRWRLVGVVLGLGGAAMAWAWWRLSRQRAGP